MAAPEARSGAGGLWLLLLPVVCCGGPFLIGALATAGALAWGGMGLGAAVIAAVVIGVLRRRRRACCEPRAGAEGLARQAGGGVAATMIRANPGAATTGPSQVRQHPWLAVTTEVALDRFARMVFVGVAVAVGLGYSILLPFDYTQRISFVNWRYFDGRYLAFTIAFALAVGWVVSLQVHAMRRIARAAARSGPRNRGGVAGVVAFIVSLLPSFLCCSPVVPTVVGLLGLSAATRLETTGRIQYFFASWQDPFLLGALALVVLSGLWSTRRLALAQCVSGACPPEEQEDGSLMAMQPAHEDRCSDGDGPRRAARVVTAKPEPPDSR